VLFVVEVAVDLVRDGGDDPVLGVLADAWQTGDFTLEESPDPQRARALEAVATEDLAQRLDRLHVVIRDGGRLLHAQHVPPLLRRHLPQLLELGGGHSEVHVKLVRIFLRGGGDLGIQARLL